MQAQIAQLDNICEAARLGVTEKKVLGELRRLAGKGIVALVNSAEVGQGRRWEAAFSTLSDKGQIHVDGRTWKLGPETTAGMAASARRAKEQSTSDQGRTQQRTHDDWMAAAFAKKKTDGSQVAVKAMEAKVKTVEDALLVVLQASKDLKAAAVKHKGQLSDQNVTALGAKIDRVTKGGGVLASILTKAGTSVMNTLSLGKQ